MDNNNAKALTAVVIDAEYADAVAADLAAHFERELKRRIPPADVCDWLTCLVLDAGLRPGEHEINVSWLHEAATSRMQRMAVQGAAYAFSPLRFGNALGTFSLNAYPVETELTDKAAFFKESVQALAAMEQVERILLVPDTETYGSMLLEAVPPQKNVTLFVMNPVPHGRCRVEHLGYSLTHALGVRGEELA